MLFALKSIVETINGWTAAEWLKFGIAIIAAIVVAVIISKLIEREPKKNHKHDVWGSEYGEPEEWPTEKEWR